MAKRVPISLDEQLVLVDHAPVVVHMTLEDAMVDPRELGTVVEPLQIAVSSHVFFVLVRRERVECVLGSVRVAELDEEEHHVRSAVADARGERGIRGGLDARGLRSE